MLVVAEREQLPVSQARAGEPAAWDALFHRYQLPLYVYVFELVHDEQASLDLVQETFIAAVRHISSLRDDAKFGSWLFGIARNLIAQDLSRDTDKLAASGDEGKPALGLIGQDNAEARFLRRQQLPVLEP